MFQGADDDELFALAVHGRLAHYPGGAIIVARDELLREMPILLSGSVFHYTQTRDGCENPLRLLKHCDESFCAQDQRMLDLLTARFPNLRVFCRWMAEEALDERDFTDSLWSKATCCRLVLPELLHDVGRCLYIDADTLVVGDLLPLWETDMEADAFPLRHRPRPSKGRSPRLKRALRITL